MGEKNAAVISCALKQPPHPGKLLHHLPNNPFPAKGKPGYQ
jgi:hypothetical protein